MKKFLLFVLGLSFCGIAAQEHLRHQKSQYYFNLSVNYLKLAQKFADDALEAYYEPDVDADYIKMLNKIRYQYQLLSLGLNPYESTTTGDLNAIANAHTAIDFDLLVDPIHGKTIMQHIEEKTLDLCKSKPTSELCSDAKQTFNAFKQYLNNVFEELKKYDEQA